MNKLILRNSIIAGFTIFSFALFAPVVANAQNARAEDAKSAAEAKKETVQESATDKKEADFTAQPKTEATEDNQTDNTPTV